MMNKNTVILFLISMIWAGFVFGRQNFFYDYKEVITPVSGGVVSFRLLGTNSMADEPKKVRHRSNPYALSIRYIADVPFSYAVLSNLKFVYRDKDEVIFEHPELRSDRRGGTQEAGYAGFDFGFISETFKLEYVDYSVKGEVTVHSSNGAAKTQEFQIILERDYKEKRTWDFWEGIMGI